jgi:hypothetical protein
MSSISHLITEPIATVRATKNCRRLIPPSRGSRHDLHREQEYPPSSKSVVDAVFQREDVTNFDQQSSVVLRGPTLTVPAERRLRQRAMIDLSAGLPRHRAAQSRRHHVVRQRCSRCSRIVRRAGDAGHAGPRDQPLSLPPGQDATRRPPPPRMLRGAASIRPVRSVARIFT